MLKNECLYDVCVIIKNINFNINIINKKIKNKM